MDEKQKLRCFSQRESVGASFLDQRSLEGALFFTGYAAGGTTAAASGAASAAAGASLTGKLSLQLMVYVFAAYPYEQDQNPYCNDISENCRHSYLLCLFLYR